MKIYHLISPTAEENIKEKLYSLHPLDRFLFVCRKIKCTFIHLLHDI